MTPPVTQSAQTKESSANARLHPGVWGWLDRRTGFDRLLRTALYEPIPGGARFAFVFGSGLLFIFISQVITGVFLALYYVPSSDHAHTTVAYITKSVTAGSFLRSLRAYGASAMIVVLLLHLSQTYIYGAYKGRRELLWLSGCLLFALILGMAFTGYLLPWDQRSYFATAVGTNTASEIPWIGESLKRMMRGGTEMGTLTISRFFVAHVCSGGHRSSFLGSRRRAPPLEAPRCHGGIRIRVVRSRRPRSSQPIRRQTRCRSHTTIGQAKIGRRGIHAQAI